MSEITKGMKSIGSKSLLNIVDEISIIDHQIRFFKKHYGQAIKIILCTGFENEKIEKKIQKYKNVECCYNPDYEQDNQTGSLSKCLKIYSPNNAIVITGGLILFDKIKIHENESSIFFVSQDIDKKNIFDIGCSHMNKDAYLFYNLHYKWIECLYISNHHMNIIINDLNTSNISNLFLFEFINHIQSRYKNFNFVQLENVKSPIKVSSLKDISYAKKQYKKYTSVSN